MPLPPETTFEEVKVRVRKATRNPNVGRTEQVVLKEGPRAFRLATLIEIIKPESGEVHHHVLKIDSIDRTKKGWFYRPEKSVSLDVVRRFAEPEQHSSATLCLDTAGPGLTEFLLVPYFGACIHSPPPPPNQVVHVLAKGGANLRTMDQVRGRARLLQSSHEWVPNQRCAGRDSQ